MTVVMLDNSAYRTALLLCIRAIPGFPAVEGLPCCKGLWCPLGQKGLLLLAELQGQGI